VFGRMLPRNVGKWKLNSPWSTVMNSQLTVDRENEFSDVKSYIILCSTILNFMA